MHDDMKDTIAVVSINHTAQLPTALELANDVLKHTPELHNNPKLVFVLTEIGSLTPESVELCKALLDANLDIPSVERSFIVHGSLQVLRFADHMTVGELCRIPAKEDLLELPSLLKDTLACLRRPPPIKGRKGAFPEEWQEYTDLLNVFKQWGDFKSFRDDAADVLNIMMVLKALKMSFYTSTTTVAVERFLKNGKAWHKDDFLEECGLYDEPQALREYGLQQAENARNALDGLFKAADTVLALVQEAKIAERFGDDGKLTISGSKHDVERVPVGVTVDDGQFFLDYKTRMRKGEDWLTITNDSLQTTVKALRANEKDVDTKLIGFFSFKDNEFTIFPDDDAPQNDDREETLITADGSAALNEVNCLRIIKKDVIEHAECSPIVRNQPGLSFGVSFVTFCSSMGGWLFGEAKGEVASSSLLEASKELQTIATDLSTIAEIGNLVGRLSGVVEVEGEKRRLATFRRTNSTRDELVVLLPEAIVDAYFFDYKSGKYMDKEGEGEDTSVQLPVFVSTSVLTVSDAARLSPHVAQLLPPRLSGLRAESVTSWKGISVGTSKSEAGSFSLAIREEQADGLVGLAIKFGVSGGVFTLTSAHEKELVV